MYSSLPYGWHGKNNYIQKYIQKVKKNTIDTKNNKIQHNSQYNIFPN